MKEDVKDEKQRKSQQEQEGTEHPESAPADDFQESQAPLLQQPEEASGTDEPVLNSQEFHSGEGGEDGAARSDYGSPTIKN